MSRIKELNIDLFNKENYDFIKKLRSDIDDLKFELDKKQDKEDNNLITEDKTVVGAINELQLTKVSEDGIRFLVDIVLQNQIFIESLQADRVFGLIDPNDQNKRIIEFDDSAFIIKDGKIGLKSDIGHQFTEEVAKRLIATVKNIAFGINKNDPLLPLEQKGLFTEQTFYSDLDKPDDNMVTDNQGNEKDIRKLGFVHYSGWAWYQEDGKEILFRSYQNKLTYNNEEVETKNNTSELISDINIDSTDINFDKN